MKGRPRTITCIGGTFLKCSPLVGLFCRPIDTMLAWFKLLAMVPFCLLIFEQQLRPGLPRG